MTGTSERTERHTRYCPECGHDGAFDGHGSEREYKRRVRPDEDDIMREYKVVRDWAEFHCPECGCLFRTLLNEIEEQQRGKVIA